MGHPPRSLRIQNYSPVLAGGSALVFLLSVFVVSQGQVRPMLPARTAAALLLMIEEGMIVAAWLAAAFGYGHVVRRMLGEFSPGAAAGRGAAVMGWTGQMAAGTAALMLVDWAAGCVGLLNALTAWIICGAGWLLTSMQLWAADAEWRDRAWPSVSWHTVLAAPAAGLLLTAATIAPGILWASEFGGYDVLSYHLQLPKEWMQRGAIAGLEHNVYSYLPNLVEAAFMHLGVWRGSMAAGAYSAQVMQAAMALLTAMTVARIVGRCSGQAGALAGVIYLATPWTIVTGSLAYTEQSMMLLGAAALMLVMPGGRGETGERNGRSIRYAAAAGALCGAAALCKLTAVGMIAAPIGAVVLMQRERRVASGAAFAAACGAVVALWAVRNAIWTGEAMFPLVGQAHWTAEQVERFAAAHGGGGVIEGVMRLGEAFLFHAQFGYLVIPAAAAGAVMAMRHAGLRGAAKAMLVMLAVQVIFWIALTHQQSRFLVPTLLPMSVLIGLGVCAAARGHAAALTAAAVAMWCTAASFTLYLMEREGQAAYFIDGVSVLAELNPQAPVDTPYTVINADPQVRRVYAEGFATPLYFTKPVTYHTVWDGSELGRAMERGGATAGLEYLKAGGYTHVLIDWGMLELWMSPGNYGYDASVKPEALRAFAEGVLERVHSWGAATLYAVPGSARPVR